MRGDAGISEGYNHHSSAVTPFPSNDPMRDGIAMLWGVIPPPTGLGYQRHIFQQPRMS